MPATKVKYQSRPNGRHTFYFKAPDGRWVGAGTFGDKEVGRTKAMQAYEASRKSGWVDPRGSRTLLANYAEQVWYPSVNRADNTRLAYDSAYRTHIKPHFGNREMGSILEPEIGTWLNGLEAKGVGRATQRKAFVVLNMIFKSARKAKVISSVPTEDVKTLPVPVRDVIIFSADQRAKFLEHVPAEWMPLVTVGFETGMRLEEIRALTPSQIRWSGSIYIDRATVQLPVGKGGPFKDKEPKGKSNRRISVDRATMKILAEATKAAGLLPDSTEKIFGLFRTEHVEDVFERACVAAGIPRRTPKDMRSTKASVMLRETGDLIAVRDHLGHADIATTQKYLAALETHDDDNVVSFEDYFKDDPAPGDIGLAEAQ